MLCFIHKKCYSSPINHPSSRDWWWWSEMTPLVSSCHLPKSVGQNVFFMRKLQRFLIPLLEKHGKTTCMLVPSTQKNILQNHLSLVEPPWNPGFKHNFLATIRGLQLHDVYSSSRLSSFIDLNQQILALVDWKWPDRTWQYLTLVVEPYPSETYDFVSWDCYPNMMGK